MWQRRQLNFLSEEGQDLFVRKQVEGLDEQKCQPGAQYKQHYIVPDSLTITDTTQTQYQELKQGLKGV